MYSIKYIKKFPQQKQVNIIYYWLMKVPDCEKWLIYFYDETHLLNLHFFDDYFLFK